jgi:hypothetical protein
MTISRCGATADAAQVISMVATTVPRHSGVVGVPYKSRGPARQLARIVQPDRHMGVDERAELLPSGKGRNEDCSYPWRLSHKGARSAGSAIGGRKRGELRPGRRAVPLIRRFAGAIHGGVPRPIDGPDLGVVCATASMHRRRSVVWTRALEAQQTLVPGPTLRMEGFHRGRATRRRPARSTDNSDMTLLGLV